MTPSLAEIKAAAEAATPESLYVVGDFVRRDGSHSTHYVRDMPGLVEAYQQAIAHRDWLVERVEELAEALRRVRKNARAWHGPGHPGRDLHAASLNVIAEWCDDALARLEGE